MFQNESLSETFHIQLRSDLHENLHEGGIHFHMNGFARKAGVDTEAKDNSETAFSSQVDKAAILIIKYTLWLRALLLMSKLKRLRVCSHLHEQW